jgi:hypothetical protein
MKLSCIGQGYAACASAKLVGVRCGWCKYKARQRSAGLFLQAASAFGLARSQGSSSRSGWPVQQNRLRGRCTGFLGYWPRSNVTPHRGARRTLVLPAHVCVRCGRLTADSTSCPSASCVREIHICRSQRDARVVESGNTYAAATPSALGSSHVRTSTRSACSFPDIATQQVAVRRHRRRPAPTCLVAAGPVLRGGVSVHLIALLSLDRAITPASLQPRRHRGTRTSERPPAGCPERAERLKSVLAARLHDSQARPSRCTVCAPPAGATGAAYRARPRYFRPGRRLSSPHGHALINPDVTFDTARARGRSYASQVPWTY